MQDDRFQRRLRELAPEAPGRHGRDTLWASGSRVATQVFQFGSTLVLARLLSPAAFGAVAIASVFTGFAAIYSDLGLGAALVQRLKPSRDLVVTTFYLNLVSGVALTVLLCALSLPLSALYGMPSLTALLSVASAQIALNVTVVPLALLERTFHFRRIAMIEVGSALASIGTVIGMAAAGAGAMSLVVGPIVAVLIQDVALWSSLKLSPIGHINRETVRVLWEFCGPLTRFNTVLYWARNLDNLILGAVAGVAALGLYTRAYALMLAPVQQVTVVLSRVLLPTLSPLQERPSEMKAVYLRALRLSAAVMVPAGASLACLAGPVVLVLFGPKWEKMTVLLTLLAAAVPVQVIVGTCGPIYQALGETRLWSRRATITAAITMGALCAGAFAGAVGVAAGYMISSFGLAWFAVSQPWHLIDLHVRDGLRAIWAPITSCLVMIIALMSYLSVSNGWNPYERLGVGTAIAVATYSMALALSDRSLLTNLLTFLLKR